MLKAEFNLIYELVSVPNVDRNPEESVKAMKLLNALTDLQTKVNNLLKPDVSRRSEQLVFECKVCGKPYGDNLSLYEHYDEEHNKN